MRSGGRSFQVRRTALCGVLIALSTVFLYLAALLPSGRVAVTAVAGLFPVAAVLAAGRGAGLFCWAGSGMLGLLLSPEKWLCLLYLAFLGFYPVVKSVMEGLRSRILEWVCKLVFFNAALALFWKLLRTILLPSLPSILQHSILFVLLCNLIFAVYDLGLSRLIGIYSGRLSTLLKRWN